MIFLTLFFPKSNNFSTGIEEEKPRLNFYTKPELVDFLKSKFKDFSYILNWCDFKRTLKSAPSKPDYMDPQEVMLNDSTSVAYWLENGEVIEKKFSEDREAILDKLFEGNYLQSDRVLYELMKTGYLPKALKRLPRDRKTENGKKIDLIPNYYEKIEKEFKQQKSVTDFAYIKIWKFFLILERFFSLIISCKS